MPPEDEELLDELELLLEDDELLELDDELLLELDDELLDDEELLEELDEELELLDELAAGLYEHQVALLGAPGKFDSEHEKLPVRVTYGANTPALPMVVSCVPLMVHVPPG
ncbi:MAG TPA: hypothetical protein VFW00_05045 [Rhodocyclaceae bacterium]|nr:hypothetical protein [Rhodocyclaceae bacterium]